jgi:hypothetical protein
VGRGRGRIGWKGRGWGKGGEMNQALYEHMNNKIKMKKKEKKINMKEKRKKGKNQYLPIRPLWKPC